MAHPKNSLDDLQNAQKKYLWLLRKINQSEGLILDYLSFITNAGRAGSNQIYAAIVGSRATTFGVSTFIFSIFS